MHFCASTFMVTKKHVVGFYVDSVFLFLGSE